MLRIALAHFSCLFLRYLYSGGANGTLDCPPWALLHIAITAN